MGKKRLTKKQLRNNIVECGLMLGICIVVLILGINLIKTWTGGKETSGRTAEESSQQVISIPEVSKEESSEKEVSKPEESSVIEISSLEESSVEESSLQESSEEESYAEESSVEESSEEESYVEESSEEESYIEESSEEDSYIEESSEEESYVEESSAAGPTVSEEGWMTVGDDYFSDAVFIGHSQTEGIFWYTDMGDITEGYYSTGLNVLDAQTDAFWEGYTLREVLSWETYNKVYIMFGLNELGYDLDFFMDEYEDLIWMITDCCPGAIIYVQSVLPVSAWRSSQGDSINNYNVNRFNVEIKAMADRNGWVYLHVWDAIANSDGVLPGDVTPDGVHFGTDVMYQWIDYLKTHAVG
ncbi:MAG: hypothetical protein IJ315_10200 [Firmicutes bacterium]|nr:hypothetical protein [Bacillota bacterium]